MIELLIEPSLITEPHEYFIHVNYGNSLHTHFHGNLTFRVFFRMNFTMGGKLGYYKNSIKVRYD